MSTSAATSEDVCIKMPMLQRPSKIHLGTAIRIDNIQCMTIVARKRGNILIKNARKFMKIIAVPKWIFEGRCNMGILMQTASEVAAEVDINRVEYFPHNDTLHTIYRCGQNSKDSTTRIRTCTFSNNVGSQF